MFEAFVGLFSGLFMTVILTTNLIGKQNSTLLWWLRQLELELLQKYCR